MADDAKASRAESVLLVEKWNSGTQEYPDTMCLHDMFRESAARNPNRTAIVYQVQFAKQCLSSTARMVVGK